MIPDVGGLTLWADLIPNSLQVPVIYLVEPTTQNLQTITSDLSRGLYSMQQQIEVR
jgi:phosphohistidine swiveling domain-containing protein